MPSTSSPKRDRSLEGVECVRFLLKCHERKGGGRTLETARSYVETMNKHAVLPTAGCPAWRVIVLGHMHAVYMREERDHVDTSY